MRRAHRLRPCATSPNPAAAQETVNSASVSGRVTDASGAVVTGAQVTARQTDTNLTATAETDRQGRFRFTYLRVGPYEITVRKAGFAAATRQLTLMLGAAFELPGSLSIGTVDVNVTVTAGTPILEAARSQIAGTGRCLRVCRGGRPADRRWRVHRAQCREGERFFSLSLRISRMFRIGRSVRAEGQVEAFNLTNRVNNLTRQGSFGTGGYPTNPSPTFNQITAVGEPRTVQLGVRLRF